MNTYQTPTCGDIGEEIEEVEFEPITLPATIPATPEVTPEPVPAEPVPVP